MFLARAELERIVKLMTNNYDHNHSHHHHHHHHGMTTQKKLLIVFLMNFSMAILELVGGFYTNSTAILSNALHDFGDSMALALGWYLEKISNKKSNKVYSFGYRRFSLLSALINSFILIGGSALILTTVIPRLINLQPVNSSGMVYFALAGFLVNGASVLLIRTGTSLNERVISWHLMEDVLGWLAVLIVALVLQFKDIPILDPILSLMITALILFNVFKNLKSVFNVFMQSTPETINQTEIEASLSKHERIEKVYHTHVWSLDGEKHVLTTHIMLKRNADLKDHLEVQKWARNEIKKYGLWHSTIEIEFTESDTCS
jgi:cobalt-zinc-cadmium efflux system protein